MLKLDTFWGKNTESKVSEPQEIQNIPSLVDDLLDHTTIVSSLQQCSFVSIENNNVSIRLSELPYGFTLQTALIKLSEEWFYLVEINYDMVMRIIYEFEGVRSESANGIVKIASGIKKFDEKRKWLYRSPHISMDKKSAMYDFQNEEIQVNRFNSEPTIINIDEFVAMMWKYGINFGIDIAKIQEIIKNNLPIKNVIIAKGKDIVPAIDASVESLRSFDMDLWFRETATGRLNPREYIRPIVQVKRDERLFKKNPIKCWSPGRDIYGNIINPNKPIDIDLAHCCGNWVRIQLIDTIEYIVANTSWYPKIILDKNKMLKHIEINDIFTIHSSIGVRTGHIIGTGIVVVHWDIDREYSLKSGDVRINGDVNWGIYIIGNIKITGSVKWLYTKDSINKLSPKTEDSIPNNGEVISKEWDITIHGFIESSYIEAKKWAIKTKNISHSIIVADIVEITGNIIGCTIIANTIICNWVVLDSRLVSGKKIDMNTSSHKNDMNHIIIYSRNFGDSIQKKSLIRKEMIDKIQKIEKNIDIEIVASFTTLSKIEEWKRRSMTRILVELMQNPEKLQEEKYTNHRAIYDKIGPILLKNGVNWDIVKKLNNDLTNISKAIVEEEKIMEEYREQLSIKIHSISWSLDMIYLVSNSSIALLQLSQEDMGIILAWWVRDSLDEWDWVWYSNMAFHIQKIVPSVQRSFFWKPTK